MLDSTNNQINNEFDSKKIIALLFKKKWIIISTVLIATILSGVISFMVPVWYKSTINCVPPKKDDSGSMMSGISSVMKNIGLTKLSGKSGGEAYSFLVILTSRTVIDSLIDIYKLDEVYDIPKSEMTKLRKAFYANVDIAFEKEGNYTISIWDEDPKRAANMANRYIEIANNVSIRLTREEAKLQTKHIEQRIATMSAEIDALNSAIIEHSKKYKMFAPEEQAKSIANALAELKLQVLKYEVIFETYKIKYGANDPETIEIGNILESTRQKLFEIQSEPGFAGDFKIGDAAAVGIKFVSMSADLEAFMKMKVMLIPMLEEAKLDQVKNIENLYVLDKAIAADKKDRPKRSLIVAGTFIGSFAFILILILLLNAYKDFKISMAEYNKKEKLI